MSFAWDENEWVAEQLQLMNSSAPNADKSEALLRSSISRAYYSIHAPCKDYHFRLWGRPEPDQEDKNKGMHRQLISSFKRQANLISDPAKKKDHLKLAEDLGRLHETRIRADYKMTFKNIDGLAPVALKMAREIRAKIGQYSSGEG